MRVALIQINTTVGALDDNKRRLLDGVNEAAAKGAVLAVAPELSMPRDYDAASVTTQRASVKQAAAMREAARAKGSAPFTATPFHQASRPALVEAARGHALPTALDELFE